MRLRSSKSPRNPSSTGIVVRCFDSLDSIQKKISNPSPKMSYLSKDIICLLSLTNHLMDCIVTCRTSDMLLNFTWQFNQFCLILTHKVANSTYSSDHLNGQFISNCLFGVSNSPKKNELENVYFCRSLLGQKCFVRFLGKLKNPRSPFKIKWSLWFLLLQKLIHPIMQ